MEDKIKLAGKFENHKLSEPGSISPKLMQHLAERFSAELIGDKIAELLHATHVTSGNRVITDNRALEAGLKLLLGYLIGLPVERREVIMRQVTTLEDLQAQAKSSPELRRALAELLDEKVPWKVDKSGPKVTV
jgi:hypothetical protein